MFSSKKVKKLISLILLVAISVVSLSGCNNNQEADNELELEYYKQAKTYIDEGKLEKAKDFINEGIEKFGESALLSSLLEDIDESATTTENVQLTVPDLKGLTESEAVKMLNDLNLDTLIYYEENAVFSPGTVIFSDPSAGSIIEADGAENGSVILYIAQEPTVTEAPTVYPVRVTASNASFVFNEQLYPAHVDSNMGFTENPYVENGYLVMNFWYDSTSGMKWNQVATVTVENQILGASIIANNYQVVANEVYYFTVKVPVSGLYNPYPYYLEMDFPVSSGHNMFINVTLIW